MQKERGEVESSIHTHNQVLQIFASVYGHQHQDTADMHYNIGCIYNDVISDADRRAEEAREKGGMEPYTYRKGYLNCADRHGTRQLFRETATEFLKRAWIEGQQEANEENPMVSVQRQESPETWKHENQNGVMGDFSQWAKTDPNFH